MEHETIRRAVGGIDVAAEGGIEVAVLEASPDRDSAGSGVVVCVARREDAPRPIQGDRERGVAAASAGVSVRQAVDALSRFEGVKRRLERTATVGDIAIYDDFAHHPTAIRKTIESVRNRHPGQRVIVAFGKNLTMKDNLQDALYEVFYELEGRASSFVPYKVAPPPNSVGGSPTRCW